MLFYKSGGYPQGSKQRRKHGIKPKQLKYNPIHRRCPPDYNTMQFKNVVCVSGLCLWVFSRWDHGFAHKNNEVREVGQSESPLSALLDGLSEYNDLEKYGLDLTIFSIAFRTN